MSVLPALFNTDLVVAAVLRFEKREVNGRDKLRMMLVSVRYAYSLATGQRLCR
jgi:hypothetical protein